MLDTTGRAQYPFPSPLKARILTKTIQREPDVPVIEGADTERGSGRVSKGHCTLSVKSIPVLPLKWKCQKRVVKLVMKLFRRGIATRDFPREVDRLLNSFPESPRRPLEGEGEMSASSCPAQITSTSKGC
jgi:hypothetical protein